MYVLGIESTCDETACAVVQDGQIILSNEVVSQSELHDIYGGVIPELACRRHIDVIVPVCEKALQQANIKLEDVDLISVSNGPGLIGPLLIGVNFAKSLALSLKKPIVGVNHIQAHLYAATMQKDVPFPCLGVVISGGHTALVVMHSPYGPYRLVSETVDDAIGEAFDKVAALLELPYPGGPKVEQLAMEGNPLRYPFKAGHVKNKPLHFSFSGLKTNVLYAVKGQNGKKNSESLISTSDKKDVAASFQHTALTDLVNKALLAAELENCKAIVFGGGVSNNQRLRDMLEVSSLPVYFPERSLTLDNAAMIAGLGYHRYQRYGQEDPLKLSVLTRIPF
ncbi:MAG: tRNA (adenosine(37)-N6)-threonylcarbamoyltransferase complex transferase subunit TsaD [Parachlamydiales bacterium]|nr:tRNA (adenosine(37)-N6)-threonylcarbamoyltransferase complex transferase subunit TsaD [Parachlamydiales bacterium]